MFLTDTYLHPIEYKSKNPVSVKFVVKMHSCIDHNINDNTLMESIALEICLALSS